MNRKVEQQYRENAPNMRKHVRGHLRLISQGTCIPTLSNKTNINNIIFRSNPKASESKTGPYRQFGGKWKYILSSLIKF